MFTQVHDELGGFGFILSDEDLVSLYLLGLPKSSHSYQDSVNGREKLWNWEHLWSDLVQGKEGGILEMGFHQRERMEKTLH